MFGKRTILGLSLSDRLIQAAEVSLSDQKLVVHRVGELELPADAGWSQPERAGQELLRFLREKQFASRRAVIGLPARWLLVRARTLPAMDEQTMAQTLRLQVEHDFAPSSRELAFDFMPSEGVAEAAAGKGRPVLVVATLAERLRQVVSAAESAGLEVSAVTSAVSAVAALGPVVNGRAGEAVTLHIGRTGSEMMVHGSGQSGTSEPLMIRHLGTGQPPGSAGRDAGLPVMANEVRRALSQGGVQLSEPRRITVWDGTDLPQERIDELSRAIGAEVEVVDPLGGGGRHIDANGVGRLEVRRFAAAIALARLGGGDERPVLDFLHSRMAEPKRARVSRRAMIATGVGAVVLAAAAYLTYEVVMDRQELAEMEARLVEMRPDIEAASQLADDVGLVGQWFGNRPRYLACLRELTVALPGNPPVWVTNLTLQENRGLMAGRTTEQRAVLQLLDGLQASGRFRELQMLDMREAGRGGTEVSFSISFRFDGSGEGVRGLEEGEGTSNLQRSTTNVQGRDGGNSAGRRPAANRDEEGMR
jgi:Tfp pilus assembly protein PilN